MVLASLQRNLVVLPIEMEYNDSMKTPIIISHRGNLNGPNSCRENSIGAIFTALNLGFHVEVDLLSYDPINKVLVLGHDSPNEFLKLDLLNSLTTKLHSMIWWHIKTPNALSFVINSPVMPNYFVHQDDDYVLTNRGIPWVHYNNKYSKIKEGIQVLPELVKSNSLEKISFRDCYGICTDYPCLYRDQYDVKDSIAG